MQNIRKITIDRVSRKPVFGGDVDKVKACRIIGVIQSSKREISQFGEYVRFLGDFIAESEVGVFRSTSLIMPKIVEDYLSVKSSACGDSYKFVIDVFYLQSPRSSSGYEYSMDVIFEDVEDDPLQELISVLEKIEKGADNIKVKRKG